ncbi:helix-turn-helix domain-containing protein [Halococcus salsus]|uniref:helix-turn-helix domain-containing protein n=1 Tax=Halococcus salsus TaxID=2162894 RepID=UPI00135BACE3|nr:helix-turn-helix domain-containing protein [Halococcus salsus]
MDEKTEELRDIFMEVTDASSVTEPQEDERGAIAPEGSPDERTADVVAAMDERYEFTTDLDREGLVAIVRGFYEDDTDAELADAVDESRHTVFQARMDLHLFRDDDVEAPFDLDTLRERLEDGTDVAAVAEEFDVAESTVRRYGRVLETWAERRAVGDRFREAFDEIYLDADLEDHTTEATRDGLDEATEGMENNLSF